jgi:hypothetical protein
MIDPGRIVLQDLVFVEGSNKPLLQARYRPLEGCRFLAQLEIPGQAECDHCCEMPVFLREIVYGHFLPSYYRPLQQGLLERLRQDLATVSEGDPGEPLLSIEQAALARAASFFYLTGQGLKTREQLETALGSRKDDYRARLLLDRLEKFFLTPEAIARERESDGSGSAAPSLPAPPDSRATVPADAADTGSSRDPGATEASESQEGSSEETTPAVDR